MLTLLHMSQLFQCTGRNNDKEVYSLSLQPTFINRHFEGCSAVARSSQIYFPLAPQHWWLSAMQSAIELVAVAAVWGVWGFPAEIKMISSSRPPPYYGLPLWFYVLLSLLVELAKRTPRTV